MSFMKNGRIKSVGAQMAKFDQSEWEYDLALYRLVQSSLQHWEKVFAERNEDRPMITTRIELRKRQIAELEAKYPAWAFSSEG